MSSTAPAADATNQKSPDTPVISGPLDEKDRPHRSVLSSLGRLWPYVKPMFPRLILSCLLAGGASLFGLLFPMAIRAIIDGPIAHRDMSAIWWPATLLLVLGVGEAVLFFLRRIVINTPAVRFEQRMRDDLYEKLQRLPVAFHDLWPAGQLISRSASDLGIIRRFVAFGGVFLVVNIATFVVGVVLLLGISWQLGLIVAGLSIPLIILCQVFERQYKDLARLSQDQAGDLTTTVEESVLGIRIIKAFGRSAHIGRRFVDQALQLRKTELDKARVVSYLWAVVVILPELALGICLWLGIERVADGAMTPGDIVAFFAIAMGMRWPIESIGWLLTEANNTAAASDRYFEVLDAPVTIASPDRPERAPGRAGRLTFNDVSYSFADAKPGTPPLLDHVDLDIQPGETIAVVGATGSGKSTLTALVSRLYDVTGGSITLDGVDLREFELADLRQRVAMAFEEPILFSASVRENVLLGMEGGTDADVQQALSVAQADFVLDLPWGLDTRIGEQGMSLSGGQRQRLALARAVVGRPSVLVLDDPLSALDIHTEAQVEAALRSVLGSTTALVIAHRASTVMLADRVALLSGGRITAVGTHSELMASNPDYRHLLASDTPDGTHPDRAGSNHRTDSTASADTSSTSHRTATSQEGAER
ncbi:ABC transporter ATP-binding protein [Nakamurella sp. DB0629]|uniref:ABC transporter ATP-binding protein n=2 Tax=Nakamurella aerolata TaxID=1656892 RepID=A0A849A5L9_9ACTN|nr:ABC transporter ATP-binding protein [Nakamurella aerolata]